MYTAEIGSNNPTAIFFLIDQSPSMEDAMETGQSKSGFVADVLNKTLSQLIILNSVMDKVKDRFEIVILTYGGHGVGPGLHSTTGDPYLHTLSSLHANAQVTTRMKRVPDGTGGLADQATKFAYWFTPEVSTGSGGTPMNQALRTTAELLAAWCANLSKAYPPTVINITDGESTDGDPSQNGELIKRASTLDGECLLFNLHISSGGGTESVFPNEPRGLDEFGRLLFSMSSYFPSPLVPYARSAGFNHVDQSSRFFAYNAGYASIVDCFDIGTKAANLR